MEGAIPVVPRGRSGWISRKDNLLLRFLLTVLLLLAVPAASAATGEPVIRDLKNTKVIRSHEQPHSILKEACIACHPKDSFDFWMLIYKGKPPSISVDTPEGKARDSAGSGAGEAAAPAVRNRYNSHDSLGCNFCHFATPTGSAPTFIVHIRDLCRLCHPGVEMHHLPEEGDRKRITAAVAGNRLPGDEGRILCTTCHKLHESTYGMREAYTQILWEGKVPNPHGKRNLCHTCHTGRIREGEEVRLAGGRDVNRLCNGCHLRDGVRRAPHVVDVASSEGTWRMDYLGYPLSQGKLICTTCHDEVSHGKPDPANPSFLRGGPYGDPERFCYRCHLEDRDRLSNPHKQIDGFGRIREDSCRFCHKVHPAPGKPKAQDLEMVADEVTLCTNCHQSRPHPDVDHIRPLSRKMKERKEEYENRHKVKLPLDGNGTVTCSTCHNPHAKGVLKDEAGVGAGSRWRVPDFREVCAPCHGRY